MHFLGFGLPGGYEWIIILGIGLLLFGKRLPEVGRSVGKSIVEFKKGIKGIEDEIDEASSSPKQMKGGTPAAEIPGSGSAPAESVQRGETSTAEASPEEKPST
jgi:sec-independent protein translocase protein TatA